MQSVVTTEHFVVKASMEASTTLITLSSMERDGPQDPRASLRHCRLQSNFNLLILKASFQLANLDTKFPSKACAHAHQLCDSMCLYDVAYGHQTTGGGQSWV